MKQYGNRDVGKLEDYYLVHVDAMTREALHSKASIAAELAHRDAIIDGLRTQLAELGAP